MIKKLSFIGALCFFNMMVLGGTSHAITVTGYNSSLYCKYFPNQCLPYFVDLTVFFQGINTDAQDYTYEVLFEPICDDPDHPDACILYFDNPGKQGNWQSNSFNFTNAIPVQITGQTITLDPNQKGKAQGTTTLGDCAYCDAVDVDGNDVYDLPQDGLLWLIFDYLEDSNGNQVDSCLDSVKYPNTTVSPWGYGDEREYWIAVFEGCIKQEKILLTYAPNLSWQPVATLFSFVNIYIDAYKNGDLVAQGDFESCEKVENQYVCLNSTIRRKDFVVR